MVTHSPPPNERELALLARPDLTFHPLRFAGQSCWGVKDPVTLRYFQLRDEEYFVLRMLDGRVSLEEIERRFSERFAPRRLERQQLHGFLGTLHRQGLLLSAAPEQGAELLNRRRQERRREWGQSLSNVLAIRFRGLDPEPLLNRLSPLAGWLFSKWAVAACLMTASAALVLVLVQFESLRVRLPEFQAFFSAGNLLWMMASLAVVKTLHEFGHALVCKRFGGECHELGLMLLVFTPCPYCNVSDAWMLPSKWRRAAIGAAGMYVELWIASICTLLWWFTEPGTLMNMLCLNLMFICSVSTLLFNGNPLLRYDGYYIFSDLLEVPNLQQQSAAVVKHYASQWLLGLPPAGERMLPARNHALIAAYAILSAVYRLFVVFAILWFFHKLLEPYRAEVIAELLGVVVIVGMAAGPAREGYRLFSSPARRKQVKRKRAAVAAAVIIAAVVLLLAVPLPQRVSAPAVVEPRGAQRVTVKSHLGGRLVSASPAGAAVRRGGRVARLENFELEAEVAALAAEQRSLEIRLASLQRLRQNDPDAESEIQATRADLNDSRQRLALRQEDLSSLTLVAPASGTVLPPASRRSHTPPEELKGWEGTPLDSHNRGAFVEPGETICLIGDPRRLEIVLMVEQADVQLVQVGQTVRIALDQLPGRVLYGVVEEINPLATSDPPPELAAGQKLPARPDESGAMRLLQPAHRVRVKLDSHDAPLTLRATGWGKILVAAEPLGVRLTRWLARTFRFEL